jgi:hypothetical protein
MDEQKDNPAPPDSAAGESATQPAAAPSLHTQRGVTDSRNRFQRRVALLFASSFAAFSLTTWLLTRTNIGSDAAHDASTPQGVVRMQLDALAQSELQVAYGLFSPQYRAEVSLEAFQRVISTHGEMFHAKTITIEEIAQSISRDEMRVRIGAADGQRYVARYSAVFIDGRWWIDAMHWRLDETPPERILASTIRRNVGGGFTTPPGCAWVLVSFHDANAQPSTTRAKTKTHIGWVVNPHPYI